MQRYCSSLRYSFLRTLFLLAADYVVGVLASWEYPSPFYCLICICLTRTTSSTSSSREPSTGKKYKHSLSLFVCLLCGSRHLRGSLPLCGGRPLCGRPLCGSVPCGALPLLCLILST